MRSKPIWRESISETVIKKPNFAFGFFVFLTLCLK